MGARDDDVSIFLMAILGRNRVVEKNENLCYKEKVIRILWLAARNEKHPDGEPLLSPGVGQ